MGCPVGRRCCARPGAAGRPGPAWPWAGRGCCTRPRAPLPAVQLTQRLTGRPTCCCPRRRGARSAIWPTSAAYQSPRSRPSCRQPSPGASPRAAGRSSTAAAARASSAISALSSATSLTSAACLRVRGLFWLPFSKCYGTCVLSKVRYAMPLALGLIRSVSALGATIPSAKWGNLLRRRVGLYFSFGAIDFGRAN